MDRIIVATHGRFGEELIKSTEMIGGQMTNAVAISLLPEMSPEEYAPLVEEELKKEGRKICFVDLFGGTPSNTLIMLSQKYDFELICGVNLPMLLEATNSSMYEDVEELKEHLLDIYSDNGFDILKRLKENMED